MVNKQIKVSVQILSHIEYNAKKYFVIHAKFQGWALKLAIHIHPNSHL